MSALPFYWRVSERNTPHLVYCSRQAAWRGPFETLHDAQVSVLEAGYQYAPPCNEVDFREGDPVASPAPKGETT